MENDMDPYPWIIWFIWKARNEKLFRGISREPCDIVRHAISECRAWHIANSVDRPDPSIRAQDRPSEFRLTDICLVDGSWTLDGIYSGLRWVWLDANGSQRLLSTQNQSRRISSIHTELEALIWAMQCMLEQSNIQAFGTDCQDVLKMIQNPDDWPNFSTELREFEDLKRRFPSFSLTYVSRANNTVADSLAKIGRSHLSSLLFLDCYISVWLTTPPQV